MTLSEAIARNHVGGETRIRHGKIKRRPSIIRTSEKLIAKSLRQAMNQRLQLRYGSFGEVSINCCSADAMVGMVLGSKARPLHSLVSENTYRRSFGKAYKAVVGPNMAKK
jgi:hypothetical protein